VTYLFEASCAQRYLEGIQNRRPREFVGWVEATYQHDTMQQEFPITLQFTFKDPME
jgi:hypothetical protein